MFVVEIPVGFLGKWQCQAFLSLGIFWDYIALCALLIANRFALMLYLSSAAH